jgi:transposase-like protein
MKTVTVQQFFEMFPDDDACLAHLMAVRYGDTLACPKCGKTGKFSRLAKVLAYSCPSCGHHIHPMMGTPFAKSHIALQKWFYAMYLFTTSRHGVPAKELERQLGVSYPTAWRMGHEIRKYLAKVDGDNSLSGHVEIDETVIGGKTPGYPGRAGMKFKTIVFGMIERGGDVITRVVPNIRKATLTPHIREHVQQGATISTDENLSYGTLNREGYKHTAVNHSKDVWVDGIHHTNSLEGFWSQVKRSIRGTHVHVSKKHLWKYLSEFEFRHNMRKTPGIMFDRLLMSF